MKLLFDANLSPKLVRRLIDLFPGSAHVFETELARFTSDTIIWEFAKLNEFTIVTADADFLALADSRGTPPMIVHLDNCNYRTNRVEELLRRSAILVAEMKPSGRAILIVRNNV